VDQEEHAIAYDTNIRIVIIKDMDLESKVVSQLKKSTTSHVMHWARVGA